MCHFLCGIYDMPLWMLVVSFPHLLITEDMSAPSTLECKTTQAYMLWHRCCLLSEETEGCSVAPLMALSFKFINEQQSSSLKREQVCATMCQTPHSASCSCQQYIYLQSYHGESGRVDVTTLPCLSLHT